MENKQKNNKLRLYIKLFLLIWLLFFVSFYVCEYLSPWYKSISFFQIAQNGGMAVLIAFLAVCFYDLMSELTPARVENRFEFVENRCRRNPTEKTRLPENATEGSVGYDFFSPEEFILFPGEKRMLWTDVKVHLRRDETLLLSPRSSVGIKKDLMLSNTIGTIDPDYFGSKDNDGNIGINLFNYGPQSQHIMHGDRIAQGTVFRVVRDKTTINKKRAGGIGSTGE